jgi:hypothetical protein
MTQQLRHNHRGGDVLRGYTACYTYIHTACTYTYTYADDADDAVNACMHDDALTNMIEEM